MSEHLNARDCMLAERAIEGALLGACVICTAAAVDGSGSITLEAIRLRLRDSRAVRIRAGESAEDGILLESTDSVVIRRMDFSDFAAPDPTRGLGGPFAPNYRPADRCCATCNDGHCLDEGVPGWHCSRYGRRPVSEGYVCDSWTEEADLDV